MAYTLKRGRKKQAFKERSVEGITPKGFKFHEIKGNKIIYKRKRC